MLPNPGTGKTDRHNLPIDSIREYRIKQTEELRTKPPAEKKRAGANKGKQRACGSPDAGEPEDSGLVPSPIAALSALQSLTLESGASSAVGSPSNSPATLSQSSVPKVTAPSPPAARPCRASKRTPSASSLNPPVTVPTQHLAVVTVEVPSTSQFLKPARSQPSGPRSDTSPASNDGSNAARIAALERRMGELEKMSDDHERRLKAIGA
jgi:hypothetical protein